MPFQTNERTRQQSISLSLSRRAYDSGYDAHERKTNLLFVPFRSVRVRTEDARASLSSRTTNDALTHRARVEIWFEFYTVCTYRCWMYWIRIVIDGS